MTDDTIRIAGDSPTVINDELPPYRHDFDGGYKPEDFEPVQMRQIPREKIQRFREWCASRDKDTATSRQVSGTHYTRCGIQPVEYALANNLNYCESFALKYITRHRTKNGAEDLRKAIHCIELLLEREYGEAPYASPQEALEQIVERKDYIRRSER